MLYSMTGFGKALGVVNEKKLRVEVKSLNSKGLDLNLKLSGLYKEKELELRSFLSQLIIRGKAECLLVIEEKIGAQARLQLNREILLDYHQNIKGFAQE
ncbi:MAG: YicC/YloC family endoribonuclease, partial [Luteibaculum sp.]